MPVYHVASAVSAERVCDYIRAQAGQRPLMVSVEKPARIRTLAQNARHWVLMTLLEGHKVKGEYYSKEDWHDVFRRKFLTPTDRRLPNGEIVREWPSTTDLSPEDFSDFATQCELWAAERGVIMGGE